MKPSQAVLPFLKLLVNDRKKLLKTLLRYTKEASKEKYFLKQYGKNGLPFVNLLDVVDIDETLDNYTFLVGTSTITDIALLTALCKSYSNCNYLEIGSYRGESLYNVAQTAESCTSVSLSKNELISIGMSEGNADLQRMFTKDLNNVNHIEANSLTFDFSSLNQTFDVIFVDANHEYHAVLSDTKNAFKLLKNDDSVIVWHDCGHNPENMRYDVIAAIMDGTPPEKRDRVYRVTNTLCGLYTNKPLKSKELSSPQLPDKTFSINIQAERFNL